MPPDPVPAHVLVTTTTATQADGERLADALLAARLVACVQFVPIHSRYRWNGEVVDDAEVLLIAKTRADLWPEIQELVTALHPYDVPELVMVPLSGGSAPYLAWIDEVTGGRVD